MCTMSRWAVAVVAAACSAASWGQAGAPRDGGIYVCTDDDGKPITRDRYIVECRHKEQRILNRDGSQRTRVPPTLTAEERAQAEAEERDRREREEAKKDSVKYDQLLLRRFPDEATHKRARDKALDASRAAIQSAESRLRDFAVERKKLSRRGRVLPWPRGAGLAQATDRRQRSPGRRAAHLDQERAGRAGAHPPTVRCRTRTAAQTVEGRDAGLARAAAAVMRGRLIAPTVPA